MCFEAGIDCKQMGFLVLYPRLTGVSARIPSNFLTVCAADTQLTSVNWRMLDPFYSANQCLSAQLVEKSLDLDR